MKTSWLSAESSPTVTYDRAVDVLYVAYEGGAAMRGTETADGAVKRFGTDGQLIGVTIVDFSEWLRRHVGRVNANE